MASEKRKLSVRLALEWAFGTEKAALELPDLTEIDDRGYGFGTEYVIMQRMRLGGVRIEGGGTSAPHDDADIISSVVATIPRELGGRGMAIRVAQCGRHMSAPDWMPGAEPKITPLEWRRGSRFQQYAKTEVLRRGAYDVVTPHPKNPARSIRRRVKFAEEWCPITVEDHPQEIEAAHREYDLWRAALAYVRDVLVEGHMLSSIELTSVLPINRPWDRLKAGARSSATSSPAPRTPEGR